MKQSRDENVRLDSIARTLEEARRLQESMLACLTSLTAKLEGEVPNLIENHPEHSTEFERHNG